MGLLAPSVQNRAAAIRLAVFDVDGVLTDGGLYYSDAGVEIKRFNVADGLGLKCLMQSGIAVALLSARATQAVSRRAHDLGIAQVVQGSADKGKDLRELAAQAGVELSAVAFVGDDLADLRALHLAGLAIAVANAATPVLHSAHYITSRVGGHGAAREVAELILTAQGLWDGVVARYQGAQ